MLNRDELIAFENIKKLILSGKFSLTGIEALALSRAMQIMDEFIKKSSAPVTTGVDKALPKIEEKQSKKKRIKEDGNKQVGATR